MNHRERAREFLADREYAKWHDEALWFVRMKRDAAAKSVKEWEDLREAAEKIKEHTIEHLGFYLREFAKNASKKGIKVHFAKDAKEHNEIVYSILKKHRVTKVVKSKSMLTEECELNPFLESRGIEVTDTDLGERIVQLRGDRPSHIVLPAIHLKKEQIGKLFEEKLHIEKGNSDPLYLTNEARKDLRDKFLKAQGAITGVNFAVSETGGIVVCTNEGNADLGTSLAKVHIACMGIEKLIPKLKHLGVFTRLLARNATGQPITSYTTHFNSPSKDKEMHIVIVDNGRSEILKNKEHKKALFCIRCGACMNTCPIYRRSGGHSYSYVIPGPIGSVLANARDLKNNGDLAFASTLCGSCTNICPVKIDLHHQLFSYRKEYVQRGYMGFKKRLSYKTASFILRNPFFFLASMKGYKAFYPFLSKMNLWGEGRALPKPAKKSFREIYKEME
ncbi:MAG: lactate utilization protein [Epsilonproteobacteria bacterium]|nr:lactate utilization protein [Campylobacterota bacterium]